MRAKVKSLTLDRVTAIALLVKAERHVIGAGRRIIRRQNIIVQFRHDGRSERERAARELLVSVKLAQRAQEARRDQLRLLLGRSAAERAFNQARFNVTR
jgi:hypothetical protein